MYLNSVKIKKTSSKVILYPIILLIYVLTGKLGLSLAFINPSVSTVWPPSGISLAVFLILGIEVWPAIFLGAFILNMTTTGIVDLSLLIALGDTLEGILAAFIIQKFIPHNNIFNKPSYVFIYTILAGLLCTIIGASFDASALFLYGSVNEADFFPVMLTWWLGSIGGVLIITPALLLWNLNYKIRWTSFQILEALFVFSILIFFSLFEFALKLPSAFKFFPLTFISMPILIWIAFRFSPREIATALLVLSMSAVWGTLNVYGFFAGKDINHALLNVQIFLAISFLTVMPLAAAVLQQKKLKEVLHINEEKYRILTNTASDAIMTIDEKNKILFCNPAVEKIFGYTISELIGKEITSLMPEYLRKRYKKRIGQYVSSGIKNHKWNNIELPGLHKSGRKIMFEISLGEVLEYSQLQFTLVIRDITIRKKAEEALIKSEQELNDFFENAVVGLSFVDSNGIIIKANKAEMDNLGYTKDEYIGQNISRFYVNQQIANEILSRLRNKEVIKNYKANLRHKNNSIRTVLINSNTYFENEKFIYARYFSKDITEQIAIEEKNAFLASIVESSNDAIIGKSTDYKIISWNYGAEQMYGFSADEVIGKHVSIIVPKGKISELEIHNKNMLQGIMLNQYETERMRKDGIIIHVSLTVSPIRDSQGRIIGASAIERDITEKINARIQLNNSLKEKDILLKEIHHRVKNNLQIVVSFLNLQAQCIEDEESIRAFEESQNRIKTMALIHENLYRSKDLSNINFSKYINDLVSNLISAYRNQGADIKFRIIVEKNSLNIDQMILLGLILNELVTNSLKYAFTKDYGEIDIKLLNKNSKCIFLVKDNGKGLPENFNFENLDSLGLNLIKVLVKQLEGNVEFNSNNLGTEFKIIF